MINFIWKVILVVDINYEFRKGIMFIRLLGKLTVYNSKKVLENIINIIKEIGIKLVVINLDNIKAIDAYGINSILILNNKLREEHDKMFICSNNCFRKKFEHQIPIISSEIDIFNVI